MCSLRARPPRVRRVESLASHTSLHAPRSTIRIGWASRYALVSGGGLNLNGLWQLLHLLFAFSYVGSLTLAEWNSRSARRTQIWPERARLFEIQSVLYLAMPGLRVFRWRP